MSQGFPKAIVIRNRPSIRDNELFEVYDHSNGVLVMRESPSQVAAWLKEFRYAWVFGSSGIWVQKNVRQGQSRRDEASRPSQHPRHVAHPIPLESLMSMNIVQNMFEPCSKSS